MPELIGLLVGLVAGVLFPWAIPSQYSLYVAAGLLAALDSALGGFRARIKGEFKLDVFLSGTVGNGHRRLPDLAGPEIGNSPVPGGSGGVRHPYVPKLCGNTPGTIDLQAKER